jgi:sugar lactone lactonase YvrE
VCKEDEAAPPRVLLTWGTNGHGQGQFDIPIAVAVNARDEIVVTDFRQSNANPQARLQRFDPEGRFLATFDLDPMPGGLAIDREGLLFATHMMRHKVAVYDPSGKVVREFGKQGSAPGEFQQPGGIVFGPDGSLYVADQVNHRVQRLTPQGEPISAWGKYGVAAGEFGGNSSVNSRTGGPHFLAFNSQGDVYTTEGTVGRIQKFKTDGTALLAFGAASRQRDSNLLARSSCTFPGTTSARAGRGVDPSAFPRCRPIVPQEEPARGGRVPAHQLRDPATA